MKLPRLNIELDHRAYFDEFCHRHGEPVLHKGRLLFADCWTYSSSDHAGPEWPPPYENEALMRQLATAYWIERRKGLKPEAFRLRGMLAGLEAQQQTHSGKLMHRVWVESEDDKGKAVRRQEVRPLDLEGLQLSLASADAALEECDRQLASLRIKSGERVA